MADNSAASKKPSDTPFKQQRLAAWQPILSPMYVIGCFILIAIAFIPIGVVVLIASHDVIEAEVDYTNDVCTWGGSPKISDGTHMISQGCSKSVSLTLTKDMKAPVYMYYKLTNFYQNHRRYAKSRSDTQVAGENPSSTSDCDPFATTDANGQTFTYSPCGLIAWSMFNDSARLYSPSKTLICDTAAFDKDSNPTNPTTKCQKSGIAWDSDRNKKFGAPYTDGTTWTGLGDSASANYYKKNGYYNNEAGHRIPSTKDEDLMVWMRTASLPTFRKLWRKIDVDLPAGTYTLNMTERFDVSAFSGHKYVVLATTTWIGGKNEFLGIAYLVVGALCFVLAIAFLVKHLTSKGRSDSASAMLREGGN